MTMTAAVYSLHVCYPGRWRTAVRTTSQAIWDHNPHVVDFDHDRQRAAQKIQLSYSSIHRCNQTSIPFLSGYCEDLSKALGVQVRQSTNRPMLYLSDEEQSWMSQVAEMGHDGPFWLLNAGYKSDFTCKAWPHSYYQEVVDRTPWIQWVQIGEIPPADRARGPGVVDHYHRGLSNVIDLRGKTDTRQFIRLAYHAAGGLGPVTFLQHLMAAWRRPYLCLLGGREPTTWVQYPCQQTFHTMGLLDCCRFEACWRSRVVPRGDGETKLEEALCDRPAQVDGEDIPECMAMIKPGRLVEVLRLCDTHPST
jgi:hypothetical protein